MVTPRLRLPLVLDSDPRVMVISDGVLDQYTPIHALIPVHHEASADCKPNTYHATEFAQQLAGDRLAERQHRPTEHHLDERSPMSTEIDERTWVDQSQEDGTYMSRDDSTYTPTGAPPSCRVRTGTGDNQQQLDNVVRSKSSLHALSRDD